MVIPGVGPNGVTSVVQTNEIKFDQDTPISHSTHILPGGVPFVPEPSAFLPDKQFPLEGIHGLSELQDYELFKKNQEI